MSISSDVLSQQVAGEVVLLDLRSERYYTLSGVGARVWELFAAEVDMEAMIERLHEEYDVSESELRRDVEELLNQLVSAGLIAR